MPLPQSEWLFSDVKEEEAVRCCVWEYMRESLPARHRLMAGGRDPIAPAAEEPLTALGMDTASEIDPPAWKRMTSSEKLRYSDVIDQYWRNGSAVPLTVVSGQSDELWTHRAVPGVRFDARGERVRVMLEVNLRHFRDSQIIEAFDHQLNAWRAGFAKGRRIIAPSHRGVLNCPSDAISGLLYLMHMRLRHHLGTAGMVRLLERHPRARNWRSDLTSTEVREFSDRLRHKGRDLYYALFPELGRFDRSATLPRSWKTRR